MVVRAINFVEISAGAALILIVGGCSLSPVIANSSIDYNSTVEDVTNSVLVTNILRARDQAPLYFSDLSQIRGSISSTLNAQATFPFGPTNRPMTGTGMRNSAQGTFSIATSPTFDIAPSNTKQFYQGVLEPVSGNLLSYYIQSGVQSNYMIHLVVSQIEKIEVNGADQKVIETINFADPENPDYPNNRFVSLVEKWYNHNHNPKAKVVVNTNVSNFGPPVPADAKAVVEAKAAGLDAKGSGVSSRLVQFSTKSTKVTLCVPEDNGTSYDSVEFVPSDVTKTPKGEDSPKSNDICNGSVSEKQAKEAKHFIFYRFRTRSVESIFYYLGFIVSIPGKAPIPLYVRPEPADNVRFSVHYRGSEYFVSEAAPGDATLTILSILNDLLNLNRDANEVPTTKAVQTVGAGP